MAKFAILLIMISLGCLFSFIFMIKQHRKTKPKISVLESTHNVSDAVLAIEEIYNLAQRNPVLSPVSVMMLPRRITSKYLACNIKLVTGLSKGELALAEKFSDKGLFYWQAELENKNTVVLKYYCKYEINNFKSFEDAVRKEIQKRHPDWHFMSDNVFISFL